MKYIPIAFMLALFAGAGCKPSKVDSLEEQLAKSWVADIVFEGSEQVYNSGGTNNSRPGYSNFRLILNPDGSLRFTDFDGVSVNGEWVLEGETRLVLKHLDPQPTETNGTLEFLVSEISGHSVSLTRVATSPKTGNTINKYILLAHQ